MAAGARGVAAVHGDRAAHARTAGLARMGARWDASSGRASAASTSATRCERIVGYWREAGLREVHVRRMSLGGGVVMSATKRADDGDGDAPRAAMRVARRHARGLRDGHGGHARLRPQRTSVRPSTRSAAAALGELS